MGVGWGGGTISISGDHGGGVDGGQWEVAYVSGPAGGALGDGPREEGGADGASVECQVQDLRIEPLKHSQE